MSGVMHDEGKLAQLDAILGVHGANLRVRLFKNNFTPAKTNVLADFTEANFTGYSAQTPAFGAAVPSSNGNGKASAGPLTFTMGVPGTTNTVYGYYVVEISGGKVWYSERFGVPLAFTTAGDNEVITPVLYQGPIDPPV